MNNATWDVTLGGTRSGSSKWKSVDADSDNDVTDEGWPTYNSTYDWEWAMVYEMSIPVGVCGTNPIAIEVISAHNSPSKDESEDVSINETTLVDYGDAPDTYSTLNGSNGARHYIIVNGPYLGISVDAEPDGQPNATANGDDVLDGTDDEDGVVFTTPLVACEQANITVTASTTGKLDAWVDFNDNGSWADPGEQIFASQPLEAGSNPLNFTVPCSTTPTVQTFARFRFSTMGGLSYNGSAPDGEVEDYEVEILGQELHDCDIRAIENATWNDNTGKWEALPGANVTWVGNTTVDLPSITPCTWRNITLNITYPKNWSAPTNISVDNDSTSLPTNWTVDSQSVTTGENATHYYIVAIIRYHVVNGNSGSGSVNISVTFHSVAPLDPDDDGDGITFSLGARSETDSVTAGSCGDSTMGDAIPEFSTLLIPLLGTIFLFFLMRRKYKK